MELAPGVHQLSAGVANWFLVEDGGRFIAIDAGTPSDWDLFVRALTSRGSGLEALEAIVLTHAHPDHTGFAEKARRTLGVTVHVHAAEADVAKGGPGAQRERGLLPYLRHREAYRTLFNFWRLGASKIVPIEEVHPFEDGETLDLPGKPAVIQVPGHTPGSCVVHIPDRNVAFTGDALVTLNPMTGRRGPQIMPAFLNHSSSQALESLAVLEGLNADLVLSGHGPPWDQGMSAAVVAARAAGLS